MVANAAAVLDRDTVEPRLRAAPEPRPALTPAQAVRTRRIPKARTADVRALDDAALLAWVIDGDEAGTRAFLERFRGLIVRTAQVTAERVGVRLGTDELRDVVGEVSLNLIAHDRRRLRLYDASRGSSVSTWIGVIVVSTTRDYLRRARRRPATPTPEEELDRVASPAPSPEAVILDKQRRQLAQQALAQLSPRDREFVELYFGAALTPEGVAEALGVSVATVYSKKAKITARLEALVQAQVEARAAG
jgi:RNA polymerase sigma-70 factor (ECF subfamily)